MENKAVEQLSQRQVREHVGYILSHALIFVRRLNDLEDSLQVVDPDAADNSPSRRLSIGDEEWRFLFVNVWETTVRSLVRAGEQVLGQKLKWRYPQHWEGRPLADDARELVHDTIHMHHFAHEALELTEPPCDAMAASTLMHLKVKLKSQMQELIGQYVETGGLADDISLRPLADDVRREVDLVEAPF